MSLFHLDEHIIFLVSLDKIKYLKFISVKKAALSFTG